MKSLANKNNNAKKTAKMTIKQKSKLSEVVSIKLKRRSSIKKSESSSSDMHSVARQFKHRLSEAARSLTTTTITKKIQPNNDDPVTNVTNSLTSSLQSLSLLPPQNDNTTTTTPTDNTTLLSNADWSTQKKKNHTKRTSSLRNLELLKQYLTFVAHETTDLSLKKEQQTIQLTLSTNPKPIEPVTEQAKSARLGATLIESLVHDTSVRMEKELYQHKYLHYCQYGRHGTSHKTPNPNPNPNPNNPDKRRPGRPPKVQLVLNNDKAAAVVEQQNRMQAKRKSLTQQNLRPPSLRKKKEAIDCICDSPHEEFGSMVQCDDCYRWLHLDCLELNQESLEEETFRCPSCFLSLGSCTNDKNSKLLSSITWRYAAQWKSRRIAALNQGMTDDEFDDDIEDHMDLDESMSLSDLEDETPSLPTTTTMITTTTESIIPTSSIMSSSSTTPSSSPPPLHFDDDGYSTDLPGPETPTDWPDMLSESRYSSTSSQETSEATTPNETLYSTDPFEFKDENMLILDPESLEILSRLALLQSLESVRKGLFAPNATDVFLGENLSKNSIVPNMMTSQAVHRYAANVPPSAICSQDLSEFSFDSGPFWEPLL